MSESVSISPALMNRAIAGQADAQFEVAVLYMQSDFNEDIELAEIELDEDTQNNSTLDENEEINN